MICISGSTGFLGKHLFGVFESKNLDPQQLLRHSSHRHAGHFLGDLDGSSLNPDALTGCQVVIHAAARAHIMHETAPDPLDAFRKVNRDGTMALAQAAQSAGVKRFIFISSIGVCGVSSHFGHPFCPSSAPAPEEPYQISKHEAEQGLLSWAERTDCELIILRPPLIHGPRAKGNLACLMSAIAAGRWLPLGGITHNRRSLLGLHNACDAIFRVATAPLPTTPNPKPRIYHLADDGVISTRRLVEVLAEGMGRSPRLISVPRSLAITAATLLGKGSQMRRLYGDLEVDASDFCKDYNWRAPVSMEQGLQQMARDFVGR